MQKIKVLTRTRSLWKERRPHRTLRSAIRRFIVSSKKLSGFDASPLMPEEQDKAVRELPRDREVVELFKKLSGADPLPAR